ncbi:hypothetical protein [Vibrio nigripulchritudo]|uniref:hypothetical protein n=1 Tax=Vibrio nigripulchritudo TaxID=28173 RepID=UPI0003B2433C|nr:hypothetical protein [Vibrio nigripulchritudo]CCN68974.1 hypothetical protein VIBNISFn118_1160071 [Vibrio nigripulchritudo SFn118]
MNKQNNTQDTENIFELTSLPVAAVQGGRFVYDFFKDKSGVINPENPVVVSLLGSQTVDLKHQLVVGLSNLGSHGVYIEELVGKDPEDINFTSFSHQINNSFNIFSDFSAGAIAPGKKVKSTPIFIPAGEKEVILIEIDKFDEERLISKPFGTITAKMTVAGVAKANLEFDIEFSVRRGK